MHPISMPSLNALKAFESAGRHMSFTVAARELNVTPAAISHQIKALESYLGAKLFHRRSRSLELTAAGQACLPGLRQGFDHLIAAIERVKSAAAIEPLVISAPPIFGAKWLVPRIAEFSVAHPEVQIRIDPLQSISKLDGRETDVAIRFGRGRYPGLRAHRLMKQEVFPVCSPILLEGKYPLLSPSDLKWHTLIHFDPNFHDPDWPQWEKWLSAAKINNIDINSGPRFSSPNFTIQAVLQGQGVALAVSLMADELVSQSRLIRLFNVNYPGNYGYYSVMSDEKSEEPRIKAFWNWLVSEATIDNVVTD
ncbi:MAG: transcriptional regulator [Acidiferrobacteraceae bacterium]|nr:transcriptional regulator [Acidiferrobacteraceae bacterium]|tara:strand:+ start:7061 stop:7984 length:924 start_codon:yes stop_codon:yes gene_type:complete